MALLKTFYLNHYTLSSYALLLLRLKKDNDIIYVGATIIRYLINYAIVFNNFNYILKQYI